MSDWYNFDDHLLDEKEESTIDNFFMKHKSESELRPLSTKEAKLKLKSWLIDLSFSLVTEDKWLDTISKVIKETKRSNLKQYILLEYPKDSGLHQLPLGMMSIVNLIIKKELDLNLFAKSHYHVKLDNPCHVFHGKTIYLGKTRRNGQYFVQVIIKI